MEIPDFIGSSSGRAVTNPEGESYSFEISVTDSNGLTITKSAESGETVVFANVPLGKANIQVFAKNSENWNCYKGVEALEVHKGNNEATVSMHELTVTMTVGEETPVTVAVKNLTRAAMTVSEDKIPSSKQFAWWLDTSSGKKTKLESDEDFESFAEDLTDSVNLTAKFGVLLSGFQNYIQTTVQSGEEVIVLKGDSPYTSFPYVSTVKNSLTGITLDLTDCTNITKLGTASTSATFNTTSKWCDTLILPNTITELDYVEYVTGDIYVQLPVTSHTLTIGNNIIHSGPSSGTQSTFNLHFMGTAADWCARVQQTERGVKSSTSGIKEATGIFYAMYTGNSNTAQNTVSLYILDSDGKEVRLMSNELRNNVGENEDKNDFILNIEPEYTDYDGVKKPLTAINDYAFNLLQCSEVRIPDSVETIGKLAFCNCYATDVYIGSGVQTIGTGAFFYWNVSTSDYSSVAYFPRSAESVDTDDLRGKRGTAYPRTIYYNGSLYDFMKIDTPADYKGLTGGPLRGAYHLYVKEPGASSYTDAKQNGYITINLKDGENLAIKGHFEAFKDSFKLKINPSPNGTGTFTLSGLAFLNTDGLTEVDFPAPEGGIPLSSETVDSNDSAFRGTRALTTIVLREEPAQYHEAGDYSKNPFKYYNASSGSLPSSSQIQTDLGKLTWYVPNESIMTKLSSTTDGWDVVTDQIEIIP